MTYSVVKYQFDSLVQDCSNSIANALELLQSYTQPSIYLYGRPNVVMIVRAGFLALMDARPSAGTALSPRWEQFQCYLWIGIDCNITKALLQNTYLKIISIKFPPFSVKYSS